MVASVTIRRTAPTTHGINDRHGVQLACGLAYGAASFKRVGLAALLLFACHAHASTHSSAQINTHTQADRVVASDVQVSTSANTQTSTDTAISTDPAQRRMLVSKPEQDGLPPAQLGISPPGMRTSARAGAGRINESLTLYNYGKTDKHIQLQLLAVDSEGKPTAANADSLRSYSLINPTDFVIPVGGYQTVRLAISPPPQISKTTHRMLLVIEQQVTDPIRSDEQGNVAISIGSRYVMPITVTVD